MYMLICSIEIMFKDPGQRSLHPGKQPWGAAMAACYVEALRDDIRFSISEKTI